jgi:DNA-binding IclR family transcriptional regulator
MPYDHRLTSDAMLRAIAALASAGQELISSTQLVEVTGASLPAVKRMLSKLVEKGRVEVTGKARATRYRLPATRAPVAAATPANPAAASPAEAASRAVPTWRAPSLALRQRLTLPLAARTPVTYRRDFVDSYKAWVDEGRPQG